MKKNGLVKKQILAVVLGLAIIVSCLPVFAVEGANFALSILAKGAGGNVADLAGMTENTSAVTNENGTFVFAYMSGVGVKVVDITDESNPHLITFADAADEAPYLMSGTVNEPNRSLVARNEPDGKSYLYALAATWGDGATDKMRKFDVTDPTKPVLVAEYNHSGAGYARDITVEGERVYTGGGNDNSISIFDAYVEGTGIYPLVTIKDESTNNNAIAVSGQYVYSGSFKGDGDVAAKFSVVKVSDPGGRNAEITYTVYTKDLKEFAPEVGGDKPNFTSIAVADGYAYITSMGYKHQQNKLITIDLANQDNEELFEGSNDDVTEYVFNTAENPLGLLGIFGGFNLEDANSLSCPNAVKIVGNLLFVNDWHHRVFVFDISEDKANPKVISMTQNGEYNWNTLYGNDWTTVEGGLSLDVYGDKLIIANNAGIQFIDISSLGIATPVKDETVTKVPFTISGSAIGAASVELTVGSSAPVTVTPVDNVWSYTVESIENGTVTVTAVSKDGSGTPIYTSEKSFTVEATAPAEIVYAAPVYDYNDTENTITSTVSATNPTSGDKDVVLLIALYKGDKLVRVGLNDSDSFTVGESSVSAFIDATPLTGDTTLEGYSLKTYLWSDMLSFNPVVGAAETSLPLQ